VDVWSVGVIVYTLLIGRAPFETVDPKAIYLRIRMNAYSFPEPCGISLQARNLIAKILQTDPKGRISLEEIG
jgi:polo-like kinase 1